MKRKILVASMLLLFTLFSMRAEDWPSASQLKQLPLDKNVKHGVLDNGLNYYILHNEEPKGKANFYIAQKVGSAQEEPDQFGLAHFLEHMAFNGTAHYPPGSLDRYLQSKGIRDGVDINAGTSYDQTVYNINNVSTSDQNLMDSVLLVLYDWSCGILLDEAEINAERGVIREEMRTREDAMQRMLQEVSPIIFPEPQYQHPIIGTEEVIMNFSPETIRAYYKKWYRPDLQGIIIVGDFDADEMEKKVVELFSKVEMPENPAERVYPPYTGNEEPIYAYYKDPELPYNLAEIMFKSEPLPRDIRNTLQLYMGLEIPKNIISYLLNQRLSEFAQSPDCGYVSAIVDFDDFFISKAAQAMNVEVIAKSDINLAVSQAMSVIARACSTGFTQSEYDRVKNIIISELQNQLNRKDKTSNNVLAQQIILHFLDNEPYPGIEADFKLWKQVFMLMNVDAINELSTDLLDLEDLVIVCAQPDKEGVTVTSEEVMIGIIQDALNAEYEPYVEESINEPLISKLPQPGQIIDKQSDPDLGKIYTLSNGAKVVVKSTDFSADEILFAAFKNGGFQSYEASQAPNVRVMSGVFENAQFGPFDHVNFNKYLAGKKISLSFGNDISRDLMVGKSTVKDLTNFMEWIYTAFTDLKADENAFNIYLEAEKTKVANQESNPSNILQSVLQSTLYNNNPFTNIPDMKMYENVDYNKSLDLLHKALSNGAAYTYVFVGNIEESDFEPLLEQYLATLPSSPIIEPSIVTPINLVKGQIKKEFKQKMLTPTVEIMDVYTGYNLPNSVLNQIFMRMAGQDVMTVFTETLREEEGGTYSPAAMGLYLPEMNVWELLYQVSTAPEKSKNIIDRADMEMDKIFSKGATADHFMRIKEGMLQQYKNNSRNNSFLRSWIIIHLSYPEINFISGYQPALESMTLEDFNNFLKNLYNGENRIQLIMEGIAE